MRGQGLPTLREDLFNRITDFNHPLANGFAPEWASGWGQDKYGVFTEINVGEVRQRLRWIPPGQFMMGSPEEELERLSWEGPQHPVTIESGFWLFDTAVTQALWLAVMGENPSHFTDDVQLPVEQVSWDDCQQFIAKINALLPGLNLCLPSETQWEYGCRALTETPFAFGSQISPDQVNYDGNHPYAGGAKGEYREKTMLVKSFKPNAWGLWQMHGNVWEWTEDSWHGSYEGAPGNGAAWESDDSSRRVVRGGSWDLNARLVRSAYRNRDEPDCRLSALGFRCARVQDAEREQI